MKKYLLPEKGNFYKANLHCHTNLSDGALSPEEVKKIYKEKGYSVIAFTDHDVMIPHPELRDDDFLPLNGYELQMHKDNVTSFDKTCHMCFIALSEDEEQACSYNSRFIDGLPDKYKKRLRLGENPYNTDRAHTPENINSIMKKSRERVSLIKQ